MTKKELRDYFAKMGKKGAQSLNKKLTAEERTASARKAATTRWARKTKKS